jgi:hypothetical protein
MAGRGFAWLTMIRLCGGARRIHRVNLIVGVSPCARGGPHGRRFSPGATSHRADRNRRPWGLFRMHRLPIFSWNFSPEVLVFIPSMVPADSAAGDRDYGLVVEVGIGRPALASSAAG